MRKQVLVLTVGGSPEPVLNAVRTARPDLVVFLCTQDQKGKPGSERSVSDTMVPQLGLETEQYWVRILDPDDLDEDWKALRSLEREIDATFPGADVALNYTGGTKTMGAALVLLGVTRADWRIELNVGERKDLIRVQSGDAVTQASVASVRLELDLQKSIKPLLETHAYGAAAQLLRELLRGTSAERDRLIRLIAAAEGFDAWDRFDHARAADNFQSHDLKKLLKDAYGRLLPLVGRNRPNGYEPVWDLVANAERRAVQRRYDDAVARLYRAMEMLAQIRLQRQFGLETGNLDRRRLPEPVLQWFPPESVANAEKKLQVGLADGWKLLAALNDPLGDTWREQGRRVLDALKMRNYSILAHGTNPIGEGGWRDAHPVFSGLIEAGCAAAGAPLERIAFPGAQLLQIL
jgi:CRISPR-associated protein (TIGR02710 family)